MRPLLLPAFLAFTAAVLPPNASIGQDAGFGRDADVRVREDSFACRETSELDRLLQRNQSGGFISGVQLYKYLQSHNCIGLSAGRVRVYAIQGQYVCIYDPKDKNKTIRPCAWTRRDMLSTIRSNPKASLISLATQDYGNVKRPMGTAHECDKLISFPSQRLGPLSPRHWRLDSLAGYLGLEPRSPSAVYSQRRRLNANSLWRRVSAEPTQVTLSQAHGLRTDS